MDQDKTIAFIGTGNMARAIITGLLQNDYPPHMIWASSPNIQQREQFQYQLPIQTTPDNKAAAKEADIIIFGVKPNMLQNVCDELKSIVQDKNPLCISLAAGVKTTTISTWLGLSTAGIIRTMPNIASAVGAGATALFATPSVSVEQKTFTESLFRSVGITLWTSDENQLDAVTPISGSGPAYLFYFFEAMQKTAESLGFEKEVAKLLVTQTAVGAAKLAMESGESFEDLRRFVTSEKGTTAAAIDVFEQHHLRDIVDEAMHAALKRAKELGK